MRPSVLLGALVCAIGCSGALASAVGCSGASTLDHGPRDTLGAYARALADGRVEEAYRLLSDDARRSLPLEAFRRILRDDPQEVRAIAARLSRPGGDTAVTATVALPDGDTLPLVWENGRWWIDGAGVDPYPQSTPQKALEAFVRAFDRKRWDVLLRFVPDARRAGLDAAKLQKAWEQTPDQRDEVARAVAAIRAALPDAQIEEVGDRATFAYGGSASARLVREHGAWKMEDFD